MLSGLHGGLQVRRIRANHVHCLQTEWWQHMLLLLGWPQINAHSTSGTNKRGCCCWYRYTSEFYCQLVTLYLALRLL
jgi:hypothetical protein